MSDYISYLKRKARFAGLLTVFFVLLVGISILLGTEMKTVAKTVGIIVVVLLSVSLYIWRTQTIRKISRKARVRLNLNDRHWLNEHIVFYRNLSKADKLIFEDRIGLFLAVIIVTEIGKDVPEKSTCFYVAASAIITFWGLPYWNYGDLSEVLVYPYNFTHENHIDKQGHILGKVHDGGLMDSTMILSLPALKHGFTLNDARNVGVHEFAHLLDKADNEIDGLPFMFTEEDRMKWSRFVEKELYKEKKASKFNGYAYSGKSEFFAVLMETYRENPNRIEKRFPELFQILEANLHN